MSSNIEGYNIFELSNNVWCLQFSEGKSFTGTFKEVILHAVVGHGIKLQEIEVAVQTMIKDGHDAAHFGMWGTFMYSFKRKFERLAS